MEGAKCGQTTSALKRTFRSRRTAIPRPRAPPDKAGAGDNMHMKMIERGRERGRARGRARGKASARERFAVRYPSHCVTLEDPECTSTMAKFLGVCLRSPKNLSTHWQSSQNMCCFSTTGMPTIPALPETRYVSRTNTKTNCCADVIAHERRSVDRHRGDLRARVLRGHVEVRAHHRHQREQKHQSTQQSSHGPWRCSFHMNACTHAPCPVL
jgi:hypothetical protein